jgi:hypothetical protein
MRKSPRLDRYSKQEAAIALGADLFRFGRLLPIISSHFELCLTSAHLAGGDRGSRLTRVRIDRNAGRFACLECGVCDAKKPYESAFAA